MRYSKTVLALAIILGAVGVFWGASAYFKAQELEKASARLMLHRNTLVADLRQFSHMPFLLSVDPLVAEALAGGDATRLNDRFRSFADSAGIDAIYLMNADGMTISASNHETPGSFVGQNYGFRPYFLAALRGELGEFYGIGATTGVPGYFYARAARSEAAEVTGVIAVKVDLSPLQDNWQASGERIILSNADGVTLLASDPDWRYRTLSPLTDAQRARILADRQFGAEPLTPLPWGPDYARRTAKIGGETFLYLSAGDLPNDWTLHLLAPDDQVATRAALITGGLAMLAGLAFMAWQFRRVRQIGAALARSEHEEAALRLANERLAIEIEDRRAAERRLKKTQAELERAGRLAALGRLASSVTHELGQPIAAMRNHLAAAEISGAETPLNARMQGLVARMEDITRQLKFFSRKGRDQFETLDLADVVDAALDLLAPNIAAVEADVRFQHPAPTILFHGNRLRLEQVATNLIRNALDAVAETARREIEVRLEDGGAEIRLEVADTGQGLRGLTIDDLREPFATTKESGQGMGLGLTISAGIVTDHGGTLCAEDRETGGALFRAVFPKGGAT